MIFKKTNPRSTSSTAMEFNIEDILASNTSEPS